MLKALLKKQLLELGSFYTQRSKSGKKGKSGRLMLLLYAFIAVMLGIAFFGMTEALSPLIDTGMPWLYFAVIGIFATVLGIFGSVFNTYSGLYQAKDNDLLLSMPIPPMKILFARMLGLYIVGFVFEGIVLIPAAVRFWMHGPVTPTGILFPILLVIVLGFFVLTLSCVFGWIVALIAKRMKNKSLATTVLSVIFIAVYYYLWMNLNNGMTALVGNSGKAAGVLQSFAYPYYLFGKAAEGDALSMLLFCLMIFAAFALCVFVLSKTFNRIVSGRQAFSKPVYVEKQAKQGNVRSALMKKEYGRFFSSSVYMLNTAMGDLLMVAAGVAAVIFRSRIAGVIKTAGLGHEVIVMIAGIAVCLISGMNTITAVSVSLEGKSLYIIRSMPIDARSVFDAKLRLHYTVTMPASVIMAAGVSIAFGLEVHEAVVVAAAGLAFVMLSASAGLALNLIKPNFDWVSETVPIKQSFSVAVAMFGGWILCILFGVIGWFAVKYVDGMQYLIACVVIFSLAARAVNRFIYGKGAEIFNDL